MENNSEFQHIEYIIQYHDHQHGKKLHYEYLTNGQLIKYCFKHHNILNYDLNKDFYDIWDVDSNCCAEELKMGDGWGYYGHPEHVQFISINNIHKVKDTIKNNINISKLFKYNYKKIKLNRSKINNNIIKEMYKPERVNTFILNNKNKHIEDIYNL